MDLIINSKLVVPSQEISWRFSRSSGVGGQNVNKLDSRVEIIFKIERSKVLSAYQKFRIKEQYKKKLVNGCICIAVEDKRSQYQNRQLARARLASILRDLLKAPPKKRVETKPTFSSQRKRLDSKKKRGELKKKRLTRIDYS